MTINVLVAIDNVTCGQCGVVFGLESSFKRKRLEDGQAFYCPNGHYVGWSESEVVKLRRSLQAAQQEAIHQRQAARVNDMERAAAERKVARLLKRVKNGVCPAGCKRTFANVRRHVASKHPALAGEIRLAEAEGR